MKAQIKKVFIPMVIGILNIASGISVAQTTKPLSLTEAIDLCIQNNKQLKLNQLRVESATASAEEARKNRLPDLAASGSYLRVSKPTISGPLGQGAAPNINQLSYAMVNASVPLFAGFKIKNGIESAKFLEEAAKLDAEANKDAVIQNAIAAYANLYKSHKTVQLLQENLKQAQLRSQDFSNLEQKGLIARNDLLRVQLQESNIKLTLADAESNMRIANLNMNIMIGLPEETQLQIDSTAFTDMTDVRPYKEFENLAFSNRKDIQALTYREHSANAGIRYAKGDYFPALKLTGGYLALSIPKFLTISNAFNAGIGVSYNIGSLWKTNAKVRSAKIQLNEVKINQELLTDHIHLEVAQAYEQYVVSKSKIEVYALALDQANENNRITKNKYRNSLVTTIDLLDADIQQLNAVINYANSKADALVAYNKLLQTSGILTYNQK